MKHYVLCENDCLIESMTKEEILTAIANVTGETSVSVNDAFISMITNQNDGSNLKFWRGTKAEYNAISTKADDTVYLFTDETPAQVAKIAAEEAVQKSMDNYLIKSDINDIVVVSELPAEPKANRLYIIV